MKKSPTSLFDRKLCAVFDAKQKIIARKTYNNEKKMM